ncbi:MAG: hypothetical protein R3E79_60775 [Caldilineaceae bacterium]
MAKSFNTLRAEMSPERRKNNQLRTELALLEMSLHEIRQHRQPGDARATTLLTREPVGPEQTALHQDIQLSALIQYLAEMGGTLKLIAQFPDEEIVINQFELAPPLLPSQR